MNIFAEVVAMSLRKFRNSAIFLLMNVLLVVRAVLKEKNSANNEKSSKVEGSVSDEKQTKTEKKESVKNKNSSSSSKEKAA